MIRGFRRLHVPLVLGLVCVIWWFHREYAIVPRSSLDPGGMPIVRAADVFPRASVERHVGAEDIQGRIFIPKSVGHEGNSPIAAGDGAVIDGIPSRKSPFLRGLKSGERFWLFCAKQYHSCTCAGAIRWGRGGPGGKWKEYPLDGTKHQHTIDCSITGSSALPDILPGDDAKHCECEMLVGDVVYNGITNPGILPPTAGAETSPLLMSSCDIVEERGKSTSSADAALWAAVRPFCDERWPSSAEASAESTGAKSGDRALSYAELRATMLAWTDEVFAEAYSRLYDGPTGWIDRAFITYFAGPPDGKHAKMVELLVVSVHKFSQYPIIVVHFGMSAPLNWSPEMFPRLVLIHMGPLPPNSGRSFNFNKMRAMIAARIKVGVQLDADQFVAPGVDALFDRTEEEITREYPRPILPSHFADRGPKDLGRYWERYCPGNPTDLKRFCAYQTTRWGHAHPTWTFWALPFLGRWLRLNLRDETLPRRIRDADKGELGVMTALRITDVPEDEDLLNIGIWEEGGEKQWCKIDQVGVDEFDALLGGMDSTGACRKGWKCSNIIADPRFHPAGVAKAFFTAHHAVDPYKQTPKYLQRLADMKGNGTLPPPIMFNGHFFRDGDAVKREHPDATCLV